MVGPRAEEFLICFTTEVLTFFMAGLLYLLCLEHVDYLGAYSIPWETGLLIPSVFVGRRDGNWEKRREEEGASLLR
jgi:hypothetical protein